jgi:glucokinase
MPAIGVDLAGRKARAVFVDDEGRAERSSVATGISPRSSARDAALDVARSSNERIDLPLGIAADTPERPAAEGMLRDVAKAKGTVCHPATAAAVGEAWTGAARGARNVVCLWLGERVLAGVVLNGEPWRGAHGLAGSAAWLALNPVERQDYKKFGSFAAEINDQGIARRLVWRVQAGDESSVVQQSGNLEAVMAADVFNGARAEDGVAMSVVRDTARYIAMAAVNLSVALDPDIVVIAGPITSATDLLNESLQQDFARRLPPAMVGQVRCEFSPLGEQAIAVGAARLAMLAKA